jgi:hypothetical protein
MAQTQAAMAPSVGERARRHAAYQQHRRHDGQHGLEFENLVEHKQRDQPGNHRDLRRRAGLADQQPQHQRPGRHHAQLDQALPSLLAENLMSAPHLFLWAK